MTNKTRDYSSIVFDPAEVARLGQMYLERRRDDRGMGIPVGLSSLDADVYPLMPGELATIIARPGCGKTGFMMCWARYRAAWLRENNITNRAVVYLTLEQSVEELHAFNVAAEARLSVTQMARGEITDDEWAACMRVAVQRTFLPLWNVGYSALTEVNQIRLDMDAISGALAIIKKTYIPDIVFVDYLQRIPAAGNAESKAVAISDNLDALKNMALRAACPFVVGVQARRDVDSTDSKVPGLDDGQWTSNIEQTSDRVLSLMRPAKYWQEGEDTGLKIKKGNQTLSVRRTGNNQLFISVLKQKLGKDNFARWVYFEPEYNKLYELETREERK